MSRSSYVEPTALGLVLAALQPTNRLVFEVMLATGLRVGDVLKLTTEQVKRQRFTVRESKTGKTRRVYLPAKLQFSCWSRPGGCTYSRAAPTGASTERGRPCGRIPCAVRRSSSGAAPCPRVRRSALTARARCTPWASTIAQAPLTTCGAS